MATDRTRGLWLTLAIGLLVATVATPALAHPGGADADDDIPVAPPTYKGNEVQVQEHLGNKVPLDASFTTSDGKRVTLGEVLQGDIPTILTFNYSDCPMLCSLQLNGLSKVMPELTQKVDKLQGFYLGGHFKIVTIDLEPKEPLDKLARMKAKYIDRLPAWQHDQAAAGWTFLKGDEATIRRVADAVGFGYTYLPDRAEWAHPAALIFLATSGAVTRYVYGIDFDVAMMRESLMLAGKAESATAVGFMNRCYHYDPEANSHARAGVLALRIGAAGFVVLLAATLGLMHFLRKQR
ncbi:MAG: SCO family protein [Deltaproteobacteria bacterium]|nr:SCO family protein [Deltaproteobacteria bacterium]